MYCPACRVEFREGFATCSDCGAALVETLGDPPAVEAPMPDGKLVKVWDTYDPFALAVAKSLLVDADIPYTVRGENFLRLFGHVSPLVGYSPAFGDYAVQVRAEDAEDATALLKDVAEHLAVDGAQEVVPEES